MSSLFAPSPSLMRWLTDGYWSVSQRKSFGMPSSFILSRNLSCCAPVFTCRGTLTGENECVKDFCRATRATAKNARIEERTATRQTKIEKILEEMEFN